MVAPLKIDPALYKYCTPRQKETLEAIERLGSAKAASIALGMNKGGASDTFLAVMKKAAKVGYAPEHDFTHPVPEGYVAKGVSTYYNKEGKADWRCDRCRCAFNCSFGLSRKLIYKRSGASVGSLDAPDHYWSFALFL